MTPNHQFSLKQKNDKNKIRIEVDGNASTPIYIYLNDGEYIEHENDVFRNMLYLKEEERGFYPKEDLLVPGKYEVEIEKNEKKGKTNDVDFDKLYQEAQECIVSQKECLAEMYKNEILKEIERERLAK